MPFENTLKSTRELVPYDIKNKYNSLEVISEVQSSSKTKLKKDLPNIPRFGKYSFVNLA